MKELKLKIIHQNWSLMGIYEDNKEIWKRELGYIYTE